MRHSAIARLANVNDADVSNFYAIRVGKEDRQKYLSEEKAERIREVLKLSKTRLVEMHLETGRTLTPLEAWQSYGLHSLGQRVTELNKRYERNSTPRRILNIQTEVGAGKHGIYKMVNHG
jgi:hypothetical protein